MDVTIWYNPKCGTCRRVREAVEAKGFKPRLVEYLKTPPTEQEIDAVCQKGGFSPQELARAKEPVYAEVAARGLDRAGWLRALREHPVLIQRPVVITPTKAVIARPPERVEEIL